RADRAAIILCHTSNAGADEFQSLQIGERPLWALVAEQVAHHWNDNQNCMLVVGATYPEVLAQVRPIVGDMPLLVPGIGAQGGDVAAVVRQGVDSRGRGLIINASRSIIFAGAPATAAKQLRDAINQHRA
ncbi:MAG: orotidine 5'-phosphate decarboxylase, partial [Chloroflexi bacterium]